MPEICRFYGIIIRMFYKEHAPPHFHAYYGDYEAEISINDLIVIAGSLPRRAELLTLDWAKLHQTELIHEWELAINKQPLVTIEPLD
jgi:hypothetical protein